MFQPLDLKVWPKRMLNKSTKLSYIGSYIYVMNRTGYTAIMSYHSMANGNVILQKARSMQERY